MVAISADTISKFILTVLLAQLLAYSAENRRTPPAELVHHCPAIQDCPFAQPLASIECSNILPIGEQLSDITEKVKQGNGLIMFFSCCGTSIGFAVGILIGKCVR